MGSRSGSTPYLSSSNHLETNSSTGSRTNPIRGNPSSFLDDNDHNVSSQAQSLYNQSRGAMSSSSGNRYLGHPTQQQVRPVSRSSGTGPLYQSTDQDRDEEDLHVSTFYRPKPKNYRQYTLSDEQYEEEQEDTRHVHSSHRGPPNSTSSHNDNSFCRAANASLNARVVQLEEHVHLLRQQNRLFMTFMQTADEQIALLRKQLKQQQQQMPHLTAIGVTSNTNMSSSTDSFPGTKANVQIAPTSLGVRAPSLARGFSAFQASSHGLTASSTPNIRPPSRGSQPVPNVHASVTTSQSTYSALRTGHNLNTTSSREGGTPTNSLIPTKFGSTFGTSNPTQQSQQQHATTSNVSSSSANPRASSSSTPTSTASGKIGRVETQTSTRPQGQAQRVVSSGMTVAQQRPPSRQAQTQSQTPVFSSTSPYTSSYPNSSDSDGHQSHQSHQSLNSRPNSTGKVHRTTPATTVNLGSRGGTEEQLRRPATQQQAKNMSSLLSVFPEELVVGGSGEYNPDVIFRQAKGLLDSSRPSPLGEEGEEAEEYPPESLLDPDGNLVPVELGMCPYCDRRMNVEALERHLAKKICQKTRKTFDVRKQRVAGVLTEQEFRALQRKEELERRKQQQLEAQQEAHANTTTQSQTHIPSVSLRAQAPHSQAYTPPQSLAQAHAAATVTQEKKPKWKRQHEEFIAAVRAGREATEALKKGIPLRNLPPARMAIATPEEDDRIQCPFCLRRYAEPAATRHISHCRNIKAKPTAIGARRQSSVSSGGSQSMATGAAADQSRRYR